MFWMFIFLDILLSSWCLEFCNLKLLALIFISWMPTSLWGRFKLVTFSRSEPLGCSARVLVFMLNSRLVLCFFIKDVGIEVNSPLWDSGCWARSEGLIYTACDYMILGNFSTDWFRLWRSKLLSSNPCK